MAYLISICVYMCLVTQLCPTLCNAMDYNPPGSSVHGTFSGKLEWVVISTSRGPCRPRERKHVSCPEDGFFTIEQLCVCVCVCVCACVHTHTHCHVRLCDPMDCNLPGSSVHAILQARILEWVVIPPPGNLPNPGIEPMSLASPALAGIFFTTEPSGKLILSN